MGQFTGFPHGDPQIHIWNFLEISDGYILKGVSSDYVRLTLFPISLLGAARQWLDQEPPNSITTWDYLVNKFLSQFFSLSKTSRSRKEILSFTQKNGENMYQAWGHFKQLSNACPHHYQANKVLAHTFYEGLDYNAKVLLNSAVGGQTLAKTCEELFDLLDKLSEGNPDYEGEITRPPASRAAGILDVDQAITINEKLDAMQHNMTMYFKQISLNQAPVNVVQQEASWCGVCGSGAHETKLCKSNSNSVNYVGNDQRDGGQQNYGNTYNSC
ncbi:hypothetical protein R3W88_024196 [Solanum pinnatisectum]|uniref:Retrotransposon gag domain-containing protein n=1 Tax=Solanum pinnatisectum TaxID=50273 RepID=A0AAV9M0J9_9SOLN|nr:hypothetical protein R3W88_024196 [Solanum pinnatisectum]